MRAAFTLVELLVAIVVFTVGVLALAATGGLVASQLGDGNRLTTAAHRARSVLDSLAATSCDGLRDGTTTRDGILSSWTVSRDSIAADIRVANTADLRRGPRRDVFSLLVPCVP